MNKATKLMEILTYNHTKVLVSKYAKVILQVATLEERIKMFMSFGMVDESKELSAALVILLQAVKEEFIEDEKGNDDK